MKPLDPYRRKRDFRRSPEPRGAASPRSGPALRFCVQKHDATRLHYDFRLELDGVLKSWAVPKGPSLDPGEKRLAVQVEDHPLDYRTFEGVIPKGNYGAGTVELWDEGSWRPEGDPREGLRKGRLHFELSGSKLQGRWVLVRIRDRGDTKPGKPNWLLMKSKDAMARSGADVTAERPESVKRATRSPRAARVPDFLEPELATRVAHAPPGDGWIHELKFDGYRLLARLEGARVKLLTRSGEDWSRRFPEHQRELAKLRARGTLLDGEIVAVDEAGVSRFQSLQEALSLQKTGNLIYEVFDAPFLEGRDLRAEPLLARKQALAAFLAKLDGDSRVRYADHVVGDGEATERQACRMALEGIISKRADSPYVSGRGSDWVKAKCDQEQEFVIAGFTDPQGGRSSLGALLLGYYERGDFVYAGRVGTGFDSVILRELREWLSRLERKTSPFARGPSAAERRGVHWVEPKLVAQVRFMNWTDDGRLRHPSFVALREDKPAREVGREPIRHAPRVSQVRPPSNGQGSVAGVSISHPERPIFPEQRLTKHDIASFYEKLAPWILPHLAERPLSLLRCPEGRTGACFFQKHWDEEIPGVRRVSIREKSGKAAYPVIDEVRGLVGLVQRGVLEFHPWGSRASAVERPDLLTLDLDPSPEVAWPDVVEAARDLRERLAKLGLLSFVKSTGGKGLHVVVPFAPGPDWESVKGFARAIASELAAEHPDRFTATLSKKARSGKIFIDWLRNGRGATAVAAYSLRARLHAPVATPLDWDELSSLARPDAFTVRSLFARLDGGRDPWADFFQVRQKLGSRQK